MAGYGYIWDTLCRWQSMLWAFGHDVEIGYRVLTVHSGLVWWHYTEMSVMIVMLRDAYDFIITWHTWLLSGQYTSHMIAFDIIALSWSACIMCHIWERVMMIIWRGDLFIHCRGLCILISYGMLSIFHLCSIDDTLIYSFMTWYSFWFILSSTWFTLCLVSLIRGKVYWLSL